MNTYVEGQDYSYLVLQSEEQEEIKPNDTSNDETIGNVQFLDSSVGEQYFTPTITNSVAKVDGTEDLNLGKFLARPTTIDTYVWQTSDPIGLLRTTQPWLDFLNNAAIKRKIDNYAFLRGKLHIKVLINATPFQFGCMRMCYQPLLGELTDKIRGNAVNSRVPYSQVPGFYIYPAKNEGGEMELPFIYYKNWLDITNATDTFNFGSLRHYIYAPLDAALTGAPTALTVRTLAWMTDVELMGSSHKLTLQADDGENDEYGQGVLSLPATAVANFAGHLTKVPVIGRFARATQIGAGAFSKIASLWGYTNVPNIRDIDGFYPMNAPQMASTDICVPYQKLTMDPKTELSIDTTPFGTSNIDELSLSYLKSRESFYGSVVWSTSNSADDLLLSTRVTPDLKAFSNVIGNGSATVGFRVDSTPLSYIGCLFNNWRGTLKFRFKVICTQYHKGRIKFQYDPLADISATNAGTNTVYTHILDLGESDEITINIPYHQALAWLRVNSRSDSNNWAGSTLAPRANTDNGILVARVYNSLEAPVTTSSLNILCYVSAGDDFEFANPAGRIDSTGVGKLPSLFALQGDESETHEITFGDKTVPDPDRFGLNFGESVLSLRKFLHRSVIMDTVPLPTGVASAYNLYRKGFQRMPYSPGYCGGGFPTTAATVTSVGTAPYAFNAMHPLPWVAGMFVGFRGSVNYMLTVNSPKITPDDIRVTRTTDSASVTAANRVAILQSSTAGSASLSAKCASFGVINNSRNGIAGYAYTSASTNPTCLFTFPDYNQKNFSLSNPSFYIAGGGVDDTQLQGVLTTIISANATATDEIGYSTITTSAAAGADFTCVYFLCCPTTDWLVGDPVPTP